VKWIYALVLAPTAFAQDAQQQAARIRAAMAPALAQQQASVRQQSQQLGVRTEPPTYAASSGTFFVPPPRCPAVPESQLKPMIDQAAGKHDLDPAIVREVARVESGFHPCAISSKGAEGLMQLMPATAAMFQVQNPFSAQDSLDAGSKFLKTLLDRYHGDLSLALSAYNAGPGAVDRAGGIPAIPETQNYVAEILKNLAPPVQPDPIPDLLNRIP
jgi:soluble lytic murein transglycosylase-like protein